MLPIREELSTHDGKLANEIHYCSELKPFLIKLHVRIFPIQSIKDWIQSFLAGHRNIPFLLEPLVHWPHQGVVKLCFVKSSWTDSTAANHAKQGVAQKFWSQTFALA